MRFRKRGKYPSGFEEGQVVQLSARHEGFDWWERVHPAKVKKVTAVKVEEESLVKLMDPSKIEEVPAGIQDADLAFVDELNKELEKKDTDQ